jgi:replicative DNA helicase
MSIGRSLPHSLEAEEYLISCCMIDGNDVIPRAVVAGISPTSFYDTKHAIIFEVVMDLFSKKMPCDVAVVAEELKTRKYLEMVGGYAFLVQVSGRIPTTAQASYFIEKVREMALLREFIKSATSIAEDCYAYTGDLPDFVSNIEARFLKTVNRANDDGTRPTLATYCKAITDEVAAIRAGTVRGDENDIRWGIADLDKYLKPFRRGELACIAARPGIGKSSLMRQVCVQNTIRDKRNCVVFTLEVTTEEFIKNTAQAISGVNPREILQYPTEDQEEFMKWASKIGEYENLLHVHDIAIGLGGILANIRIHHSKRPVDVVFIDYLQLINEKMQQGENRDQLLGRITRSLKQLANELKCVVIILSQMNRNSEKDNRAPHLADLRESGNIEADCDRVDFIYRPSENPITKMEQKFDDEDVKTFFCDILQRKGRNVGEASCGVIFERKPARFVSLSRYK